MRVFECPECGAKQSARGATVVTHRCPKKQNQWVAWREVRNESGNPAPGA